MTTQNSWNSGLPVTAVNGGTGMRTFATGDLLVGAPTASLSKLTIGSDGAVLTADSTQTNGIRWASSNTSAILAVSGGGTGANTLKQYGIVIGQGTSPLQATTLDTNGQVLIGRTGAAPTAGNIVANDQSITVTNGPGSIALAATPWFTEVVVADSTGQQVGYNGRNYIVDTITSGTVYLALDSQGSVTNRECKIISTKGAKFKVGIYTGGNVTSLTFGTTKITDGNTFFTSRGQGDSLTLYNYGNTTWVVTASVGNFDLTTT